MPDLPSLTEQIDLEYVLDSVPDPGARSDLEGLGLFIAFRIYSASLGGIDHHLVGRYPI